MQELAHGGVWRSGELVELRNPLYDLWARYVKSTSDGLFQPYSYIAPNFRDVIAEGESGPLNNAWAAAQASGHGARSLAARKMAFAVPNAAAVAAIKAIGKPVVDVGAGTGYWAWLLEQAGVDVVCFDIKPDETNEYIDADFWHEVHEGGAEVLMNGSYTDHALMLCWPPYDEAMAVACLAAYEGDTLIYVGEGPGGCTADDSFFRELDKSWELLVEVHIPQWPGMRDDFEIHKRR